MSAAQQAEDGLVSTGIGLREWLGAEKRLRRLGFRVLARSQSFFVEGTTGPLVRGERERARRWGEELAVGLAAPRPSHGRVT
jgi:hypothetical protein